MASQTVGHDPQVGPGTLPCGSRKCYLHKHYSGHDPMTRWVPTKISFENPLFRISTYCLLWIEQDVLIVVCVFR